MSEKHWRNDYFYTVNELDVKKAQEFEMPRGKKVLFGLNSDSYWDMDATDFAEDFWDNHDGWECKWPIDLRIYRRLDDDEGSVELIGDFEARPHFMTFTNRATTQPKEKDAG